MKHDEKANGFLLGVLIGGLIGSVTALLIAPSSGKKLRRKISDRAENLYEDAQEYYNSGKEKAEEYYREGKKMASDIVDEAKKLVKTQH